MTELEKTTAFVGAAVLVVALAMATAPSRNAPEAFFDVGETFFPEFSDPEAATTLEVVEFDEDTAAAAVFRVTNREGLWTIPSHHDYPADGEERLANTAAGMIAIIKDDFRSDSVTDHEAFGVIDPLDEGISTLRGRGRRVTFKGPSEEVLADLIIGDAVEGRPGLNFVRVPDQNRVYAARTDIGISTNFSDWIETNLLGVERDDVKHVELNEYQIDELTGGVRNRGEFIIDWVEDDVWTGNDIPEGKEIDYVQMNLLVGGLMGLRIVGVRPKPEGLSGNLRQAFEARRITNADLQAMQSRGFYPTQDGEMLSNEGELKVRTEPGVLYTLRFGEILYGSGNAVSIGDETSDDEDTGTGENRYVLINTEFDADTLPEPPRPSNRDFENKAETQWTDVDRENNERADLHAQWERRTEEGRARAEELATRFSSWYYVVSAGSYNRVHKTRDELLKDIEEADAEASPLIPELSLDSEPPATESFEATTSAAPVDQAPPATPAPATPAEPVDTEPPITPGPPVESETPVETVSEEEPEPSDEEPPPAAPDPVPPA
ncbi:MAG: DUF4340 domain-containing protein [Acidobacteriota bacterium]|nr:DUF4340 domain-containing protein [Acidobacteriota bacterium]